jgi:hypothetical protein
MRSVLPPAAAAGATPHKTVKQNEKTQSNRTTSASTFKNRHPPSRTSSYGWRGPSSKRGAPRLPAAQKSARLRGWRAEKRKPMVSVSVAGYGGRLPARHNAAIFAQVHRAALSVFDARSTRPKAGSARSTTSASSWQGLVLGPGGAPVPPGCSVANQTRGRRASSRFGNASRKRPSLDEVHGR